MKLLTIIFLLSSNLFYGQTSKKPKLVVGIVVDQMRYDYLYRYLDKYSDKGFKKLINEGFNCKNTQYHYAVTFTGPGHAHIFNGSVPALSGIIGNNWFDRNKNQSIYVSSDPDVVTVGEGGVKSGQMSPRNMLVTSIGDQLRLSNQFKSKVIGIALKDRGAIFPAGHTGMAYWFDTATGNWITSSYYLQNLPKWVQEFNDRHLPDAYLKNKWETMLSVNQYVESEEDDQPYENAVLVKNKVTFPYELSDYSKIMSAPAGNTLTKDFALSAIRNEELGQHAFTDFLSISFSATDYVGHASGTHSVEIEDTYLRLDKDIGEIISVLEQSLGKENILIFLTADHGVADIPAFSKKNKINAGVYWGGESISLTEKVIKHHFNASKWIKTMENQQIYFDLDSVSKYPEALDKIFRGLKDSLNTREGVYTTINLKDFSGNTLPANFAEMIRNSYHPGRSGDVMILLEPGWLEGYTKGTTHGTMYAYDTHVPLLWYGYNIKKKNLYRKILIADIAPTLAQILDILEPSGNVGVPIVELLNN